MKNILYTRVSSIGQAKGNGDDRQRLNIPSIQFDKVFNDIESGSVPFFERKEGKQLIDYIEECQDSVTLYIEDVDRLGRDLLDILQTFKYLNDKDINVFIHRYGMFSLVDGKQNDTFKLVLSLMGTFAELEKAKINERTKQGRELKKRKDVELKKLDLKHKDITYKGRKVGATESDESFKNKHAKVIQLLVENPKVTLIDQHDKRKKKTKYINELSLRELVKYLEENHIKRSVNTLRKIKDFVRVAI